MVLKEKKMIEEFENNSDFARVLSMTWIIIHTASSLKLTEMNKELEGEDVK